MVAAQEALVPPPIPAEAAYLVRWWSELHNRRRESMSGVAAVTWADIDAWARRTERNPTPYDVSVICRIDDAFRRIMNAKDDDG